MPNTLTTPEVLEAAHQLRAITPSTVGSGLDSTGYWLTLTHPCGRTSTAVAENADELDDALDSLRFDIAEHPTRCTTCQESNR